MSSEQWLACLVAQHNQNRDAFFTHTRRDTHTHTHTHTCLSHTHTHAVAHTHIHTYTHKHTRTNQATAIPVRAVLPVAAVPPSAAWPPGWSSAAVIGVSAVLISTTWHCPAQAAATVTTVTLRCNLAHHRLHQQMAHAKKQVIQEHVSNNQLSCLNSSSKQTTPIREHRAPIRAQRALHAIVQWIAGGAAMKLYDTEACYSATSASGHNSPCSSALQASAGHNGTGRVQPQWCWRLGP
jgi:hypothetical protein